MPQSVLVYSDIKTYLRLAGTGRDAALTLLADGVSSWVNRITGRDWSSAARSLEAHAADGTVDFLVLKHYPASALTAVSVDGTPLTVTDDLTCTLDGERGLLYRTDGACWPDTRHRKVILVSYTGGPPNIPDDLKLAALEISSWLWRSSGGKANDSSAGISESLWNQALMDLPQASEILQMHRDSARGYIL